ncbi:MAG: NAD-binding protein [Candidatus Acidiferrales bacterium]
MLFGIVIYLFVLQGLQHYNPQEGCRMLASEMSNHIIIGYTHLGARLVEHLQHARQPYVLVEKDPTAVDHLVRAGEPVIVDDAKQTTTLEQAGAARARLIAVTSNNIETALLLTKRVRESNPKAPIVVRCFLDDFTEILETLGATLVISSSKSAFNEVARYIGGSD